MLDKDDWLSDYYGEFKKEEAPSAPVVDERPLPGFPACKRYPVAKLRKLLPAKFLEQLEQNQQVASCCRHPENHEIEARYSNEDHRDRELPDIYINHCSCGRRHARLMCGGGERPFWDIR